MSDAGAVLWGMCDGVGAGVLIQGPCCALMLELLFGHVRMPAGGAECSAVLAVVWACECACIVVLTLCALMLPCCALMLPCCALMLPFCALMLPCCAGAVGWVCPWGVDCLDVLKPKAVDWAS